MSSNPWAIANDYMLAFRAAGEGPLEQPRLMRPKFRFKVHYHLGSRLKSNMMILIFSDRLARFGSDHDGRIGRSIVPVQLKRRPTKSKISRPHGKAGDEKIPFTSFRFCLLFRVPIRASPVFLGRMWRISLGLETTVSLSIRF
jgi:hypothetical protein